MRVGFQEEAEIPDHPFRLCLGGTEEVRGEVTPRRGGAAASQAPPPGEVPNRSSLVVQFSRALSRRLVPVTKHCDHETTGSCCSLEPARPLVSRVSTRRRRAAKRVAKNLELAKLGQVKVSEELMGWQGDCRSGHREY